MTEPRGTWTFTHRAAFTAVHRIEAAPRSDPEHALHAHRYDLEAVLAADYLTATGEFPGAATLDSEADAFIAAYLHQRDLTVAFDFASTPAAIAEYLFQVLDQFVDNLTEVRLTVDATAVYTYRSAS